MTSPLYRRELLATGTSIGVATLAGCAGLLGGDSADGWPMYQYDSAHTCAHPSRSGPGRSNLLEEFRATIVPWTERL